VTKKTTSSTLKISWVDVRAGLLFPFNLKKWEVQIQAQTNAPSNSATFGDWVVVDLFRKRKLKHFFSGLNSNTFYRFRVRPVFKDGSVGEFSVTNPVRTA